MRNRLILPRYLYNLALLRERDSHPTVVRYELASGAGLKANRSARTGPAGAGVIPYMLPLADAFAELDDIVGNLRR